ncbi:MAG: alpha/beta fold hydrolase [Clostridiales bacterium]|nr:alpha/beta fold hydrolase [Clostridiales bacterium]
MQGWMIALLIIACVVAVLAAAFFIGSFVAVHAILGRRKPLSPQKAEKLGMTPERYGVNSAWFNGVKEFFKPLSLTAYDGVALKATLIKQREGNGRVAICCHGYGAAPRSMQVQAKLFYDRGYDVLLPSMRGHGESDGKVGMAWIDRFDLLRWIDKVIQLYGENVQIALCGVSMGGSTVIAAAGMNVPPQVKCVIDDCGFSSQKGVYAAHVKRSHLPVVIALLPLAVGVKLFHGYSLYDADITALAKKMTVPALFIHGGGDKFVPTALGRELFEACASENKQFVEIEGAQHACAYAADPDKYSEAFNAFIDSCVEGSEFVFDSNELIPEPEPEKEESAEQNPDSETPEQEAENPAVEGETKDSEAPSGEVPAEAVKEDAPTKEDNGDELSDE